MASRVITLLRDDRGVSALEYALIAGLIFAVIIACGHLYGPQIQLALGNIGSSLLLRDLGT
jgi:Flp pilus assembly pilin Flp